MFQLETPRLILRDFRPDDFEQFLAGTRDPAYGRYYPEEELTESHLRDVFRRILPPPTGHPRPIYQLALCLPDGPLAGTAGVRLEPGAHRQASFGCALARPYWGQGLAAEGATRLLDFAFAELPVERVYAETNAENLAARALAERLRMAQEGLFRHHRYFRGRWWDTAVYAILRDEWLAGARQRSTKGAEP